MANQLIMREMCTKVFLNKVKGMEKENKSTQTVNGTKVISPMTWNKGMDPITLTMEIDMKDSGKTICSTAKGNNSTTMVTCLIMKEDGWTMNCMGKEF